MTDFDSFSEINLILSISTQDLLNGHEELIRSAQVESGADAKHKRVEEQKLVDKLVKSLDNATTALSKEIESGRVIRINPQTLAQMEKAIEAALNTPKVVDVKINEIYLSIFGWNTVLWHALNRMQKLLRTAEVLKYSRGIKVDKVEKGEKEHRKRRDEK